MQISLIYKSIQFHHNIKLDQGGEVMKTHDENKSVRRLKGILILFFVLLLFGSASYVTAAPVASFTRDPVSGVVPLTVQFVDTSTGGPMVNWSWNFQDGTLGSTVPNPTHLFESAGQFPVSLVVSTATETSTPAIQFVNVSPYAQFTATPTTGYAPLSVQFTDTSLGNPDGWLWRFGDGNTSTSKNPLHIFYRSGVYTVNLTSTKNFMSNQSVNMTIIVNPRADFAITPSIGFAGTTSFQFNASSTTGGPVLQYVWDFEQWNQSWTSPTAVFNKTFDTANTYTIRLTVNGNSGTSDTTTRTLTVYPVAIFSANPPNIVEGRPVSFDGTASKGNLTHSPAGTWDWNFGDGSTASGSNVTHGFPPGKFTVTLTVTKNGLSNSTTTTVSSDSGNLYLLRSGINGNTFFRASKYGISPGGSVKFTAYSTRSVIKPLFRSDALTTYTWEFIGAYDPVGHYIKQGPSASPELTQVFQSPDIYTVRLNVTDSRDTFTVTKPRLIVVR
jgi:PKD repeat protein